MQLLKILHLLNLLEIHGLKGHTLLFINAWLKTHKKIGCWWSPLIELMPQV